MLFMKTADTGVKWRILTVQFQSIYYLYEKIKNIIRKQLDCGSL